MMLQNLDFFRSIVTHKHYNFIHNLFIHPNFLGKGVGGHLLNASIKKMNKPLRLKCVSENHKALKFYEKNGWKKVNEEGEKEKYWVMIYE